MKNDLLMISTFIDKKMIEILLNSLKSNNSIKLSLVLLAQKGMKIDVSEYESEFNDIIVINTDNLCGLSLARNICIKYISENKIEAKYVMFPDDDCFFDSDFFENFRMVTADNLPYIIASYGTGSKTHIIKTNNKDGDRLSINSSNIVASINLLVPYSLFVQVGLFDENLGVGAKYGAGEDADYYFRCFEHIDFFIYTNKLFNFHPFATNKNKELTFLQLKSKYIKYGNGAVYLYYKHQMIRSALYLCARGFGGVIISLLKFQFRMSCVYFIVGFTRSFMLIKLACSRKSN